ncbi:MAG: UDP-N-acetylmuramoyl-tripeptide--D-alanyl-D-alanine ligase, partial [bacterium]
LSRLCLIIDKNTHATRGNLNNLFGVPLTLLRANPKARWWVIEMGTNQFGEIGELSRISRPDGAILTSIAESHLEFLKNTEGVAAEKRDIMAGMSPGSSLVVPADLKHLDLVQEKAKQQEIRIVRYALEDQNQKAEWIVSRNITSEGFKGFELFGKYFSSGALHPLQLRNLTAALVLLYENGVDSEQLQQAVSGLDFQVSGRFEWKRLDEGWLIDDSYNANPGSFRGVLQSIRFMHPKTPLIAVIGPMAELGENAEQFHSEVGEVIYHSGCKKLLVLGGDLGESYLEGWKNAGGPKEDAKRFESLEELQKDFQQEWDQKSIVLVKGSRSAAMERFVKAILNHESE